MQLVVVVVVPKGGEGNSISTQVNFDLVSWLFCVLILDLYFFIFVFWMIIYVCCLLALPIGKGMEGKGLGIGVRFGHKILGSNFTQCVIDIWNIMYAYDGLGMFHTNASI